MVGRTSTNVRRAVEIRSRGPDGKCQGLSCHYRATSTLHARAGPLIRYVHFCRGHDIQPFPISEDVLYSYIKACGDSAPTYPKSLMRAIGFAKHVLGLDLKGDVLGSGRTRGCVDSHYSCRRKLVQRPPLSVQQVSDLEMIVKDDSRTDSDKLAAGYFLFLIFGRLRYSDGLQISELKLDKVVHQGKTYGFLECVAERSKTSISLERKIRHIPVAIPMTGFTDPSWVEPWLAVRKKLKLVEGANIPLMPSPAEGGGWSKDRSLLIYSRDSMSGPLREMTAMIEEIRAGRFIPDASRSGFFSLRDVGRDDEELPVIPDLGGGSDSTSEDSHGSASEEDDDPTIEEKALGKVVGTWNPVGASDAVPLVRHFVSRCIHVVEDESGTSMRPVCST